VEDQSDLEEDQDEKPIRYGSHSIQIKEEKIIYVLVHSSMKKMRTKLSAAETVADAINTE